MTSLPNCRRPFDRGTLLKIIWRFPVDRRRTLMLEKSTLLDILRFGERVSLLAYLI